jgi:uncharacterized protein YjbI with pentapeptide repeats
MAPAWQGKIERAAQKALAVVSGLFILFEANLTSGDLSGANLSGAYPRPQPRVAGRF